MSDAPRARGSTSKPARGGYSRKAKANAASSSANNQQPPSPVATSSASASTVLPRIDRRGSDTSAPKNEVVVAVRHIASPQERDSDSASIPVPTPPRRPSSTTATAPNTETSLAYHSGDASGGSSSKTAWCTPRSPTPTDVDQPHLTAFFASSGESEAGGTASEGLATPARLKSVEETLAATEALYEVDMHKLQTDNDKFFEIATSALQHVDVIQSDLPGLADSFQHTKSVLTDLSGNIATLHQQHEETKQRMLDQMSRAIDASADEMVALTETHAAEKAQLTTTHLEKMREACTSFEAKIGGLEQTLRDTETSYQEKLERLRESSDAQLQQLQVSTQAELMLAKETARAELEALEKMSNLKLAALETSSKEELERREKELQEQLESLRSSSSSAYEELRITSSANYEQLRERSEAELMELQRSSQEELMEVRTALTNEIESLTRDSAAEISALKSKAADELQTLRLQKDEELANVRASLTSECERISREAAEEKARVNKLREDQLSQLEECRSRETAALSAQLDETRSTHVKEVEGLHAEYKARIKAMEDSATTEMIEIKASHVAQMTDTTRKAEANLSETVTHYEDRLLFMSENHATEMKHTTQQASLDREALVAKYERQALEAEEDRRRERDTLILGYETELESLKQSTREQIDSSVTAHETYVSQLRESHAAKVLSLETTLRDKETQLTQQLEAKSLELQQSEDRVRVLETSLEALQADFYRCSERSSEALACKEMDISDQESRVLLLDAMIQKTQAHLDESQRRLKFAEDDRQVKAGTILELTFVIKSRDEEIDKLRNSLLDTVKVVNTKTEILEMTAETLSSKSKELEDTRAALRIESGRLTMVEESMHQKEGMLEDTTLKVESMRLNMENMRLEMKRMQMDMKLQLEHTEGEMELKNGEIRRLHGAVSELKQKHDFSQQTIERLEESLGIANRQVDEAQRRINLLRLEASNNAEELKKANDLLCERESALLVSCQEKQAIAAEKSKLQIQASNLAVLSQRLREEAERNAMSADDTRARYCLSMEKIVAEKDERLRAEKHLLMLELKATKDMVAYLEGVEDRYKTASGELETQHSQRTALEVELSALRDSEKRMKEELQASQLEIRTQSNSINELKDAAEASEARYITMLETERRHVGDLRAEIDEVSEKLQQSLSAVQHLEREKKQLGEDLARASRDHEFLQASINEEKTSIFETMSRLRKDLGDREEEVRQISSERAQLQELADRTHSELSQALNDLKGTREELAVRTQECERLGEIVRELETAISEINVRRSEEATIHADSCRDYDAEITARRDELHVKSLELKECLENSQLQREDYESVIRGIVEKANASVHDLALELKRVEIEKAESLHDLQDANAKALQQLKEESSHELQCARAEKDEAMRLADEEKYELLRVAEEEKLAILRRAEEEKADMLLERQLRESASRTHRAQERERLRRLAKYEQERLLELNESAQMLAEEQQTRLLAVLHRSKDENASLMIEHCLAEAAVKLQLVHEQEELRKIAHDERSRLLELNEASRMVAEEHRVRLLDREAERQRLMDEKQTARLLEQHAREQMAKEEVCAMLLQRHEQDQEAIAQQRERFSEQHERFVMWNAEHETQLFESHLADVEALQDNHTVEQAKLVNELAEVKQVLDERVAKADADKLELERVHMAALLTTAERHQVELDTSIRSVREEENARLREKHRAEVDALTREFDQKAEVIQLRTAQEHLVRINDMLEKSRVEQQRHAEIVDGLKQELEMRNTALIKATRQLEEQNQAIRAMEMTLKAKRVDAKAPLNANLLDIEAQIEDVQQEQEAQLSTTEKELAEANKVVAAKSAAIESLRKELAIVVEKSEGTRSAEQLLSLLRQQIETYLLEEHRVKLTELSGVRLDGEQDVLECMKRYFAVCCRPRSGTSQKSIAPVLLATEDIQSRLIDYDRIFALLQGKASPDGEESCTATSAMAETVTTLQHNFHLLRSSIQELLTGSSEGSHDTEDPGVGKLIEQLEALRGFFDNLELSALSDSDRATRQTEVVQILAQHERLMQTVSTSSERDEVHSVDDVCSHFDKLEKMLIRAREVTKSNEFRCLTDFERILTECELQHLQLGEFKQGDLQRRGSARVESSPTPHSTTNFVGAADVATLLLEYGMFVTSCLDALGLSENQSTGEQPSTAVILDGIRDLMSIICRFEALQPQLGSPRRRGDEITIVASSSGKPSLRNKVTAIVAFADELKSMAEFAQGILDEECEVGNAYEVGSNMSSTSLASLRSLTITPTPSSGLISADVQERTVDSPAFAVDNLELSLAVDASMDPNFNEQGRPGDDEPDAIPALSASPSAFMADSLLDISLVMSDHQRLLAETAHLVGKASREAGGAKMSLNFGSEISRLVREHCVLLTLTRRLFKLKDARRDLPSLLECVAILQRFTQRLPLLGLHQDASSDGSSNNNSSTSLSSVPQPLSWSYDLVHSGSSSNTFAEGSNDIDGSGGSASRTSLAASEKTIRSSLSVFETIEDVARHLQDYDYLVQHMKKNHMTDLPSSAFANVESFASTLSDNVSALTLAQQVLGLEDTISAVPHIAEAIQDVVQKTKHLVLRSTSEHSTESMDADTPNGVASILGQFEAILATLMEFSGLLSWLRQTILQIPIASTDESNRDTSQPVNLLDATAISDLKQHVRDFVSQLYDLQAANHELEQELEAMQHAQQQMLRELRNESDILSRLDASEVGNDVGEQSSPQRRRADVLETLLAKQEAFRRQSSFQGREQQRELSYLREHGLLTGNLNEDEANNSEENKSGISSTTRLAIYKRLIDDNHSLERQLQHMQQETASALSRHEVQVQALNQQLENVSARHKAETQEFHRQAELVRQHGCNTADEQIAALRQSLEATAKKLAETETQWQEQRQDLELRLSEATKRQQDTESRLINEKNALEAQVFDLKRAMEDEKASAAAEISSLQHAQREQKDAFEQQLANWKHLAQAALDEEMAYLRRSDSLAFATSKLQCFSDGSISDRDEERGYSRLNVWKALVAHVDRISDRLAAAEERDENEYEFLRSTGLVDASSSDNTPPLASIRKLLFQELTAFRTREAAQRRELEDEAAFVRSEVKMEFDESQPTNSRQRVYKALLDGQSALIDDKVDRELEAARETAFLEANNLHFDNRTAALEHLVRVCDQLEVLRKHADEERDLLVQQRVCTPQELRRPLRQRSGEDGDETLHTESGVDTSDSLGEFASIRLDVYRKLLSNEQLARDALQDQRQEHEVALEDALGELQRQHQVELALMTRTIEQLEHAIMLREDAISGLGNQLTKQRETEAAKMRLEFDEEKQKDMAEALARWSEQSEAAIAAATAAATTDAAAFVEDKHKREMERRQRECDDRIAALSDVHAKQLALVSAVRVDGETQAKQQIEESATRQVAKVRAGLLERLAKRDGVSVATIYRCIRMATDVLNPNAYVTSASAGSTDAIAAPPSRHGSASTSGGGNNSDKIPVAVTNSVIALVKELKALKEHVASSLDQLQVDEHDNAGSSLDAGPPLSVSSSFLLGDAKSSNDSDSAEDNEIAWTEGKDQVADAILSAYREVMQYASRQLLTRQQAANDALARLYTLVIGEEAAAASESANNSSMAGEELARQREELSPRLALEIELTRERIAREDAELKHKLHDVCARRLLEDQRSMEAALTKALEASQLESKQLQTRIEQLEHYQRLALTSSRHFQSSPNAARTVTPTHGYGSSGSTSSVVMPIRPERPRDYPQPTTKGGGTAHKERFVSDLERETGQRRTNSTMNVPSISGSYHSDGGGTIRRRRPLPAGEIDTSSLSLSAAPPTTARGSLLDQELWFQGVRTLHFVSFFVSVFYVPKQGVFRVEVLNSDTEQQQTVYVTQAEMQQFVAQHDREKRRRHGNSEGVDSHQNEDAWIDEPSRRGDVVDALFDHVKVYGEDTGNLLLAFE